MSFKKSIFISYRRTDEPFAATLLYDKLAHFFGGDLIFKDVDSFEPGDDFPAKLAQYVEDSDILLAIIGPKWLASEDGLGRRIDNPLDWVRIEIAAALEQRKRVIPILVNGAVMPNTDELPANLQPLAHKHAFRISADRAGPESKGLIKSLTRILEQAAKERTDDKLKAQADSQRWAEDKTIRQREEKLEVAPEAAVDAPHYSSELTTPTIVLPRITVFGVGGAGGCAVNHMIEKKLEGVDFVVANTDAQALQQSFSQTRLQLGVKLTEGLGSGARASVGAAACMEVIEQIVDHLAGSHICFITAGMGGGTGTGAAPIFAQAARELGVVTVAVVTKPFQLEGANRMRQAEDGVAALQEVVDGLIILPNQNLFRIASEKTTFNEAYSIADDLIYQSVKSITDLMVHPGQIDLDFADVRSALDGMGKAMMGTGEANGEDRAIQAAEKALANPFIDEISLRGAKSVLIIITGAHDLTLFELDEAANRIREEVESETKILVGSTLDVAMEGMMRVSIVVSVANKK